MRLKSELYKKEQEEIVDKIIKILDLENNNIIIVSEQTSETIKLLGKNIDVKEFNNK